MNTIKFKVKVPEGLVGSPRGFKNKLIVLNEGGYAEVFRVYNWGTVIGIAISDPKVNEGDGEEKPYWEIDVATQNGTILTMDKKILNGISIGSEAYFKNGEWTSSISMFNSDEYVWCGFIKISEEKVLTRIRYIMKKC